MYIGILWLEMDVSFLSMVNEIEVKDGFHEITSAPSSTMNEGITEHNRNRFSKIQGALGYTSCVDGAVKRTREKSFWNGRLGLVVLKGARGILKKTVFLIYFILSKWLAKPWVV